MYSLRVEKEGKVKIFSFRIFQSYSHLRRWSEETQLKQWGRDLFRVTFNYACLTDLIQTLDWEGKQLG